MRLTTDAGRIGFVDFEKWQETSRQRRQFSSIDRGMLTTRAILKDRATAGRLRRGFSTAHHPRPVEVMARAACFSRRQFHRLMLQVLGETPGTHQRRLRLDHSAWLLLTSRATVLDVALETGFGNHETFTRAFRRRFGVTPSVFRKDCGKTLPRSIRVALSAALHTHHG
jgi:transcriptional regulator GlxA family with amidase domain